MKNWTTLCYRQPRLIVLIILFIIVAGYSAWKILPRLEDPVINNRFAIITSQLPGATATRVEALVTEKIEDNIQSLKEIKEIESTSRPGIAVLVIELNDDITNPDPVWSKIRDRLTKAQSELPANATRPILDEERTYPFTKLIALEGTHANTSLSLLRRYATTLKRRIQALPGTDHARLYGAPREEILVDINSTKLRALNLSLQQLGNIIQNADSKLPAGIIHQKKHDYILEVSGEFLNLDRIKNIPIKTDDDGKVIRLSSIATISQGLVDPPTDLVRVSNQRAVLVAARIKPNQKIDFWDAKVGTLLHQFKQQLPSDIKLNIVFDQKHYTDARLSNLRNSLIIGAILVALTLLITLGWRASSIITLTLPLTMLLALFFLSLLGTSIHQMSIIGLIVALGLVVDNAIVMVSAIRRLLLEGKSRLEAVGLAVQYYWAPLLSSTLTTILAFTPIILLTGPVGEFTRGIAVSVIAALVSSYALSIFVVPSVAGRIMPKDSRVKSIWHNGYASTTLAHHFKKILTFVLTYRVKAAIITAIIPLLGLLSLPLLINQFFPRTDRNQFYVQFILPEQTSIALTEKITQSAYPVIMNYPSVTSVHWFIGGSAAPFYYNKIAARDLSPNFAEAIINVKKIKDIKTVIPQLQKQLDSLYPSAQVLVRSLWQGPPFEAPIEVKVFGPHLKTLKEIGEQVRHLLQQIPDVIQTQSSLQFNANKILLTADEDKLRTLNLSLNDISNDLNQHLQGELNGSLLQGPEELPVRLRLAKPFRNSIEWLKSYQFNNGKLSLNNSLGIPLTAFAKVQLVPSTASVTHTDSQRVNIIRGYISNTIIPQVALNQFKKKLKEANLKLPPGYYIQYGGEAKERAEAIGNLFAKINVVIALAILILVLVFNSFSLMAVVLVVAIQAIGLGMFSLFIFRFPFGFNSIIGIMGLVGVAINAAIILLSNLQRNLKHKPKTVDSVVNVIVSESSRHIFSTTLTTMLGFVPLLLTPGDLWPPFAVAFIGGIALTTFVSFFFVPSVYLLIFSRKVQPKPHVAA